MKAPRRASSVKQTGGGQRLERLAQRRARNAELLGELDLVQTFAIGELAGDDHLLDAFAN